MNAADAMPEGGTLGVRTEYVAAADEVVVEFTDTGIGIPPEWLPKVFDPFFTRKDKGTGPGLSVVYGIDPAHRERAVVHSPHGHQDAGHRQAPGPHARA